CGECRDTAVLPRQTVRIGSPSLAPCRVTLDILQTIATCAQPKEAGTAPGCAGDVPRDGGEAWQVVSRHTYPFGTTVTVCRSAWAIRSPLVARARPSRYFAVFGSSPPKACSWICQQRNRAMRSSVKAGGGEQRNVHRVRSASRSIDRRRSISASIVGCEGGGSVKGIREVVAPITVGFGDAVPQGGAVATSWNGWRGKEKWSDRGQYPRRGVLGSRSDGVAAVHLLAEIVS